MPNGRNKGLKGDTGRDAGGFVALPWAVLDCIAYARLSHPAKSLLIELARQFVRDNNGRMLLSYAYLFTRGWKSADVITRAKRELITAGFIYETVMGHRPNKASWYAVTWRVLDKINGYDEGAAEGFRRGAYMDSTPLQPQKTREQIFKKWEGAGSKPAKKQKSAVDKNATLRPPGGIESAFIAPSGGIESIPVAPSGGAIEAILTPMPTPSHGNHLEIPSPGACPMSAVSGIGAKRGTLHLPKKQSAPPFDSPQPEVIRVRVSEFDPADYDPETGEYFHRPPKPVQHQKQAAQLWVKSELQNRGRINAR
jgi:hypothetical protein